jgi:hypothetical protein
VLTPFNGESIAFSINIFGKSVKVGIHMQTSELVHDVHKTQLKMDQ